MPCGAHTTEFAHRTMAQLPAMPHGSQLRTAPHPPASRSARAHPRRPPTCSRSRSSSRSASAARQRFSSAVACDTRRVPHTTCQVPRVRCAVLQACRGNMLRRDSQYPRAPAASPLPPSFPLHSAYQHLSESRILLNRCTQTFNTRIPIPPPDIPPVPWPPVPSAAQSLPR